MYATVLAVLSGVLLYLSDYPARLWFLQLAANGKILARRDHFSEGSGPISAETPLYGGGTIYSRFGGWLEISCALAMAALSVWRLMVRHF